MSNIEQRLVEWRGNNPLFKWRKEQNVGRSTVSVIVGVSSNTIVKWEHGTSKPSAESFERIAKIMKVKSADIKAAWAQWFEELRM